MTQSDDGIPGDGDDIVILTTPDGSDTLTLDSIIGDSSTMMDSLDTSWDPRYMGIDDDDYIADSDIVVGMPGSGCDTFTIPNSLPGLKSEWSTFLDPTVTIGKTEITEEVAEKMVALIDLIEGMDDDAQLKQMFETQVSMNKIRGENGDS